MQKLLNKKRLNRKSMRTSRIPVKCHQNEKYKTINLKQYVDTHWHYGGAAAQCA